MEVEELSEKPGLAPLYGKALVTSLPLVGGGGDGLPENGLTLRDVEVDRHRLAEYDHVCGFRTTERLPPTYPQVLAFPLAMQLMTDGDFPFPLLGLVHIGNRVSQVRPLRASEILTLAVRAENLRPHAKGRQVDLVTEVLVGEETVLTAVATYLKRESGGSGDSGHGSQSSSPSGEGSSSEQAGEAEAEARPEPRRTATWRVPGDIGRRYAGVSGDRNPIHLHPLTARLFGFPSAIAHGMWMKARCLAAFEGRLPDALETEVAFKKPMQIPAKATFSSARAGGGFVFALHDAKKGAPHLTGEVRPLD